MLEVKEVSNINYFKKEFCFCTFVNKKDQYERLIKSLELKGFNDSNSDFCYIDNSLENKFEAFAGIRHFLNLSTAKYTIVLHQDIELFDDIEVLRKILQDLDLNYNWAIAGNAGVKEVGLHFSHITHGDGKEFFEGPLPQEVMTLDENFLVFNSKNRISISSDLEGFHLYGADLCLIAKMLGYKCFAINFHVLHYGEGSANAAFYKIQSQLIKKYTRIKKTQFIATTCTKFIVSKSALLNKILNTKFILSFFKRIYKIKRALKP